MRTRVLAGSLALVAGAVGVVLAAAPASALNVVNVTTTVDGGAGSLRAAFTTANTDADDTEIVLAAGTTYDLDTCSVAEDDDNATGDLDHDAGGLGDDLTITGNGATIQQTCTDERVIDDLSSGALTVTDVTITGGDTPDDGGGIDTSAPFTMTGSTVTGNDAGGTGGGVESGGGGTITDSLVTGNTAVGEGGGLDLSGGGTIVEITRSTISGNTSGDVGGGVEASGGSADFTMTDSVVSGNEATGEGGGVIASGGGVISTVTGSTFSDNTSGDVGGGLSTSGGGPTITITNSTFDGNTAAHGGGVALGGVGPTLLTHLTFADNVATVDGSQLSDAFGVGNPGFSSVTLFGTVLSGAADVCDLTSPSTSTGYNYATDASCGLGAGTGDVSGGADPELEPLGDDGGPTPTRLPAFGSPLVDAIALADCSATVTDDQRDVARPDGPGCDIGAVEGEGDEPVDPPEPPVDPPEPPVVGPIPASPAFTG